MRITATFRRRIGILATGVFATMGLFVAGAPAGSAAPWTPPQFVRTVGHPGHAGVYAWGAATAPDGTIIIGDYWNYVVRRYSPNGQLLQTMSSRGSGPGQNQAPHGIGVDPVDGSIYVADMNSPDHHILKLAADGSFVRNITTSVPGVTIPYPYVTHLTVGPDRNVYAVSSHNLPYLFTQILVFDKDGVFQHTVGTAGSGPDQLGLVHGIAVDANKNVYLADATKGLIQVYDANGAFVRSIGSHGEGPGKFKGDMRGLAIDNARGLIYASDSEASQIEVFTLTGTYVRTLGSEGSGPGQFRDGGRELTVGTNGTLYAPDFGNYRVLTFSPSGAYLGQIPNPAPGPVDGGFNTPTGLAVNRSNGALYVADTFNHRIQQFDATGAFVRTWGFRGSTDPMALNYPRGVAVDAATNNVWVANSRQGNDKVYTATGTFLRQFGRWGTGTGQYQLERDLVVRGNRVYHADSLNDRLVATTLTGQVLWSQPCGVNFVPGHGSGQLEGCTGIDVDTAGNIYAAAVSENAIYVFSPTGKLLRKSVGKVSWPYDVAVRGNLLYVTEGNANRVSVFTTGMVKQGSFGSRGSGDGQFVTPRGIDIDNAGNIYVMDAGNERVVVFKARS